MHLVRRFYHSQLVRGSFFIFLAQNAVSFGNFLYNLLMGRLLTPSDYGNLGALMSLLVILSIPLAVFQLFIVKLVSKLLGEGKMKFIKQLLQQLRWKTSLFAVISALILFIVHRRIGQFLQLSDNLPLFLIILMIIVSFPSALNRSTLQGLLKFPLLAFNSFVEIGLKLAISVILVFLNYGLFGALLGPMIGSLSSFILTAVELKLFLGFAPNYEKSEELSMPKLTEAIPVLLTTASLTLFFSADVVWVRHFFDDITTGQYVALSTLGRIPFYAVGPVVSVMFPIISSRASSKTPYMLPLLGSLVLSLAVSISFIFIYFFAPKFIITLFYGQRFLEIVPLLGLFAFFMAIYGVNSILTYFLLSVSYYQPIFFLFLITLLQSVLIFINHQSLTIIIYINILVSLIYLSFAAFFVYQKEKKYIYNIFGKISSL